MVARKGLSLSLSLLVAIAVLATPLGSTGESICDNEKSMIEKDLGREENWKCQGEQFEVNVLSEPAGHFHCSNEVHEPVYSCGDIEYHEHPPTSGDYRPEAPAYGEYKYLPPQRWLHALELGALAFLYHPCANPDQVTSLKHLASSCLWEHVITPYHSLTEGEPLAIVSWGCVYRMEWVNPPEAKLWIMRHALKTNSSVIAGDGPYDEGLLHKARKLSSSQICPEGPDPTSHDEENDDSSHNDPHPVTEEPTSPCHSNTPNENTGDESGDTNTNATSCDNAHSTVTVTVLQPHHKAITALLVFLLLILFVAVLFIAWRMCSAWRRNRHKQTKYKSVSKFFPFSYGKDSGNTIAIPELGMPKSASAERETLLNESDEDEL